MPKADRREAALSAVGYQHIRLDPEHQTVTLQRPAMRLDLGAVAKGYATDRALQQLRDLGIRHALVNAGGDMSLGRAPPGSRGWRIGVAPLEAGEEPSRILLLERCGVATSGDAWQYVEINGRRYSHILDPRTGLGLTTRSSVTVVAADGMMADSLASAVSVLGRDKGLALIESTPGASALVVQVIDGQVQTHPSARFSQLPTAD
jgi:thiamine biosynthesis lipoprotein